MIKIVVDEKTHIVPAKKNDGTMCLYFMNGEQKDLELEVKEKYFAVIEIKNVNNFKEVVKKILNCII